MHTFFIKIYKIMYYIGNLLSKSLLKEKERARERERERREARLI
jgi:hypothetical protein